VTDSLIQRTNMVESQIRPSDVTDRRIMRAMQLVLRERFVPASMASLAYMDNDVPLVEPGSGAKGALRSLMSPRNFAKLLQLAAIEPDSSVLVVGTGRGYSAAIVAELARSVVALESDAELAAMAKTSLAARAYVTVVVGDLSGGHASAGPFDAVVVDGMIAVRPEMLLGQLKPGGRLVAIVRTGSVGRATRWLRSGAHFAETGAFEATAGVLPGFDATPAFVL
jgi:protein-L-isoaspartate(D-aspartate) O-methyltransferase